MQPKTALCQCMPKPTCFVSRATEVATSRSDSPCPAGDDSLLSLTTTYLASGLQALSDEPLDALAVQTKLGRAQPRRTVFNVERCERGQQGVCS